MLISVHMNWFRIRRIAKGLLIAVVAFILFNLFCLQQRRVEKEMVWRCTPNSPFGLPTLELRFKESPAYREIMTGPTAENLCQELPKSNKKTLRVLFEVSGSDFYGVRGQRIEAIDGQKYLYQIGDEGISSATGEGPYPFRSIFRRYFFQKER